MIRQQPNMTEEKLLRVKYSTQFIAIIAIMAEVIKLEHGNELVDTYFKTPLANQFARRIKADALEIQQAIKRNDKIGEVKLHDDNIEEYASELWRLLNFFIGLPLSQIREVMSGLANAKIEVENQNEADTSELWQAIYDTIDGGILGAQIENRPVSEGIKNATDVICDLVGHSVNVVGL